MTIGKETQVITGRAAEIIASVATIAPAIAMPVGKAVIHFAAGQVSPNCGAPSRRCGFSCEIL